MKKKILIVIVAVAMMIPLLAVGVSADFSPETGWSEPVGTVNGSSYLVESYINDDWAPIQVSTYNTFLYRMYLSADGIAFTGVNISNYIGVGDKLGSLYFCRFFDGEKYTRVQDGEQYYDGIVFTRVTAAANTMSFYYRTGWSSSSNLGAIYLTNGELAGKNTWFPNGIKEGAYLDIYVLDPDLIPLAVDSDFDITTDVYEVLPDTHPFLALIELMFDNFSRIIGGLAAGVTGAFTALIWENPEATEKTLSTAAKFIFTIAGLSIGMTVFYMVLRLIRFGRQR